MKNIYYIPSVEGVAAADRLSKMPPVELNNVMWLDNGYAPHVEARLAYDSRNLYVHFTVKEPHICATHMEQNSDVCQDSCVEFFFQPDPANDSRYLNFEMNCLGILLVGIGSCRDDLQFITRESDGIFDIHTSVTLENMAQYDGQWTVEYTIPMSFLRQYFPNLTFESGHKMSANFYNCGDDDERSHYLCWNYIDAPRPDFHLPQFFGDIVMK